MLLLIALIAGAGSGSGPATRGPVPVVRPGTTVRATLPLVVSIDGGVSTLSCAVAGTTQAGCLSSSDWNTFSTGAGGDYEQWPSTRQDGGAGAFIPAIDYEWTGPGSDTSMLLVVNDFYFNSLSDGGNAIGSQQIRGYDGGIIIDAQGIYTVRGANGDHNIWYNIRTGDHGWPVVGNGIRYEFCHTPSWDSEHYGNVQNPDWDGTNYAFDLNFTNAHAVTAIFAADGAENLYIRIDGTPQLTLIIPGVRQRAGQLYCTAIELVQIGSSGMCKTWVKHNSCAQSDVGHCFAQTIIGAETSGTFGCPSSGTYMTLGNRQACGDTSNCAPSTGHFSALRVSTKP